jgi:hypothetical protein
MRRPSIISPNVRAIRENPLVSVAVELCFMAVAGNWVKD